MARANLTRSASTRSAISRWTAADIMAYSASVRTALLLATWYALWKRLSVGLTEGAPVWASVKATQIDVYPDEDPSGVS